MNFNKLKIEDYLNNLPYKDLAVIINDYEKENHLAPVFVNDEQIVRELQSQGKKIGCPLLKDFAFLTLNRYDVVEPIYNIHEFINFQDELVPYVIANSEKYNLPKEDIPVRDEYIAYDFDWLKNHWSKKLSREQRIMNLENIRNEVNKTDLNFGEELDKIISNFKNHAISYDEAKQQFVSKFKKYASKTKDLSEEDINTLKKKIVKVYNDYTNHNIKKYEDLPPEPWLETFNPLLKSGRTQEIDQELQKLMQVKRKKPNEPTKEELALEQKRRSYVNPKERPSDKAINDLTKRYFKCNYDDLDGLKAFAEKLGIDDPKEYANVINSLCLQCKRNGINLNMLEDYFKRYTRDFDAYKFSKFASDPNKKSEALNERKETLKNIKKDVEKFLFQYESDKNAEALNELKTVYNKYKEPFLQGRISQDQYEDEIVKVLKKYAPNKQSKKFTKEKLERIVNNFKKLKLEIYLQAANEYKDDFRYGSILEVLLAINNFLEKTAKSDEKGFELIVRALQTNSDLEKAKNFLESCIGKNEKDIHAEIAKLSASTAPSAP